MRKIIASLNITLDGYISGYNGTLDWHFKYWDAEMAQRMTLELSKADTLLLGRFTYQAMEKYWPAKATECLCPRDEVAFAVMMNRHKKLVCSKTLDSLQWNNSELLKGNIQTKAQYAKEYWDRS